MPRALPANPTGLRGPGQDVFPEGAKEEARRRGLKKEAVTVFKNEQVEDKGGDWNSGWKAQAKKVRGRIDPVGGSSGRQELFAEGIHESTTHIVTMDPGTEVDSKDRLEIEGIMWTITAEEIVSDPSSTKVQVKQV